MDIQNEIKRKEELIEKLLVAAEAVESKELWKNAGDSRDLMQKLGIEYRLGKPGKAGEIEAIFEYIDKLEKGIERLQWSLSMR